MRQWALRILLILLVQAASSPAAAHTRSTSYSVWTLNAGQVELRVRFAEIDLTRLQIHPDYSPDYAQQIAGILREDLQLFRGDEACVYADDFSQWRQGGQVVLQTALRCTDAGEYRIHSRLLHAPLPSHLHFAQVIWPDGQRLERVLTSDADSWELAADTPADAPSSLGGFWWLGVEHILSGWDHLAFVLGLILLAATLGQVAWLVTGFTIAHSLTLAMAVLGWVQPAAAAVEALIALSIVLIAAEASWQLAGRPRWLPACLAGLLCVLATLPTLGLSPLTLLGMALFSLCYFSLLQRSQRPHRLRALVAFGFGLFHGFGFAGLLAELQLPTANLATALLGFNLGVESGQILVVLLLWPLLRFVGKKQAAVQKLGSAAIAGLGTYWFVLRAFV